MDSERPSSSDLTPILEVSKRNTVNETTKSAPESTSLNPLESTPAPQEFSSIDEFLKEAQPSSTEPESPVLQETPPPVAEVPQSEPQREVQSEPQGEPKTEPLGESKTEPTLPVQTPTETGRIDPMMEIRQFAENLSPALAPAAAGYPFSLLIEGPLNDLEKSKLIDLIAKANIDIREPDLEPQFQSQRILIPRISEYAAIFMIQALRDTQAVMKFGPAESIFAMQPADDTFHAGTSESPHVEILIENEPSQAEKLPLLSSHSLPSEEPYEVLDSVSASASLHTTFVEAAKSPEFQRVLDALQRELKYKAFRKGANAILGFNVSLTPLSISTQYRLLAVGMAVKIKNSPNPEKG